MARRSQLSFPSGLAIRTRLVLSAAALLLALLGLTPAPALGQSVTDPTIVAFVPSADHYGTASDGTPLVTRYELQFFLMGAARPFQTGPLGKPAVAADGTIRVKLASVFAALPTPGIIYESRVEAVGPRGTAASAASNSFIFSTPCTFSIAPGNQSIGQGGGSFSETVTSGAGCRWTAASNVSWITITSGDNGSGNGTVNFSVAANPESERSGTLTIGGATVTVVQSEGLPTAPVGFRVERPPQP